MSFLVFLFSRFARAVMRPRELPRDCCDMRVIVTGSSSFELAGQVGEPLTGRKKTINLFPVAQLELNHMLNKQELREIH